MSSAKLSLEKPQQSSLQTPTEKMIQRSQSGLDSEVIDADGKVYKLKFPDPLDEFDLSAALGEQSSNIGLLTRALPLIYIDSIEGISLPIPRSYNEVRAAIKRVGREGMKAVMGAIQRFAEAEQGKNQQELISDLKK